MTILFAGSERGDFEEVGTLTTSTSTSYRDSNYTRQSVAPNENSSIRTPALSAPTFWMSWNWTRVNIATNSASDRVIFWITNENGSTRFRIQNNGFSPTSRLFQYWNGSAWTTLATLSISDAYIRFTVAIHCDATNGFIRVYTGSTLIAEVTGNTVTMFGNSARQATWTYGATGGSLWEYVNEVIIADEDTTSMRLATIGPTADGANTAWTGTFADVDEVGRDAADMIFSATAGQKETFVMSDVNATAMGTRVVRALVVASHMRRGTTGPQNCDALLRIGGTDYVGGNFGTLNTNAQTKQAIIESSPATSVAFTKAEIDAMEIGLQSAA